MNIELYIEDYLIDMSDKLDYTINKTFLDLLNPTDIKTEFTKTIEIPFTARNNNIFGSIYRLDNQLQVSPNTSIFEYFDPTKKLPCKLVLNNEVLFEGYCKMNSITNTRKKQTYNINIFGGVGIIFSELKKLAPTKEQLGEGLGTEYVLDLFSELDKRQPIDRNLVSNLFEHSTPYKYTDEEIDAQYDANITDINNDFDNRRTATWNEYQKRIDAATTIVEKQRLMKERTDALASLEGQRKSTLESNETDRKKAHAEKHHLIHRIGFAPVAGGLNKDFDSVNIYSYNKNLDPEKKQEVVSFEQLLVNGGKNPDISKMLVGNGVLPRAYGEYRSYYQKPFIYVEPLFQRVCDKLTQLTGKNIVLDPDWFNKTNLHYHYLVMMCKNLPLDKPDPINYRFRTNNTMGHTNDGSDSQSWPIDQASMTIITDPLYFQGTNNDSKAITFKDNFIKIGNDKVAKMDSNLKFDLVIDSTTGLQPGYKLNIPNNAVIELQLNTQIYPDDYQIFPWKGGGKTLNTRTYWLMANTKANSRKVKNNEFPSNITPILLNCSTVQGSYGTRKMQISLPVNDIITFGNTACVDSSICVNYNEVLLRYAFAYRFKDLGGMKTNFVRAGDGRNGYVDLTNDGYNLDSHLESSGQSFQLSMSTNCRSYRQLNFADFLQDQTLYDFFLNYIKTFRLVIYEKENTVYIQTPQTYFKGHTITDVSKKLDKEKDFVLTPIVFDSKYIKFNYEDVDTEINNSYKKSFGANYGELKMITSYNFNNETKDIFENQYPFIGISPSILDWNHIYRNEFEAGVPDEIMGCYYKLNNNIQEFSDYGPCYAFWVGTKKFDCIANGGNYRDVYITDDCDYEIRNDKYLYHLNDSETDMVTGSYATQIYSYPQIDSLASRAFLASSVATLWNAPKYRYTKVQPYGANPILDIYSLYYKKFYDEIYNPNNYKLECSLYITPTEFREFSFKKFIVIDNVLFFVNKIIDYNPTTTESTKVELIKVTNITNYIN